MTGTQQAPVAVGHPRLFRSPDCERHAMRQTRCSQWRGADIPVHVRAHCSRFPALRGDETLTEQVSDALGRRSTRCIVVEHEDLEREARSLAIVLEEDRVEGRRWTIETVAEPNDARSHHRLLDTVVAAPECPPDVCWRPPSQGMEKFPIPVDATLERTVLELRGSLPEVTALPGDAQLEPADAHGLDIASMALRVVTLNNAAFGSHPEQGGLAVSDVEQRLRSPWFDPSMLLFAHRDGVDVGFVWMKHVPSRPIELYVVGVVPGTPIRGLGRSLVTHGFAAAGRARPEAHGEAMLFVDQANTRATSLYRSLGFEAVRRQDVVRLVRS